MNHDESKEPRQSTTNETAAAMEAAPVPLIIMDTDGKIRNVNTAMEVETGRTREKLIGSEFWDCFAYPDDAKAVFEETMRAGFAKDRSLELVRREGFPIPVHLNAAVYYDATDTAAGVVAAPRNIGIFKRSEMELQKKCDGLEKKIQEITSQIETANRELDAFPFWIIEDLKAPFQSIAASIAVLAENKIIPFDPDGPGLERIRMASAAMNEMMDSLRRLSSVGRQKLDRVTVDLTSLARRVADNLEKAEPDRRVSFVISPHLVAHGDPGLLLTVFEKLIANAWKALAGESAPVIEVGVLEGEEVRAFYVRDNSFSSPAANVPGALRPPRTPRNAVEFSDMGVSRATVRRIIHRHGGRVWAESHRGKGTAFYFTIPE